MPHFPKPNIDKKVVARVALTTVESYCFNADLYDLGKHSFRVDWSGF